MASPSGPSQPSLKATDISIDIQVTRQYGARQVETEAGYTFYMSVTDYVVTLHYQNTVPFSRVCASVLTRGEGMAINIGEMYREYGAWCGPLGHPLHMEAFLVDENFEEDKEMKLRDAKKFVYIVEVRIHPEYRGHGVSLLALDKFFKSSELGADNVIAILQAAPINPPPDDDDCIEASERLKRHWKRLGFEDWGKNHDFVLCIPTAISERPAIENVVPGLFGES